MITIEDGEEEIKKGDSFSWSHTCSGKDKYIVILSEDADKIKLVEYNDPNNPDVEVIVTDNITFEF